LRLLELDDVVRDMVLNGLLNLGQARALLPIADPTQRQALAAKAVREGWTVRMMEQSVRQTGAGRRSSGAVVTAPQGRTPSSAHLHDLERHLGEHLGTRVEIKQGRGKGAGRLVIRFFNNEQFEGILERLGFTVD
jgi:ParB family chromosome partitioning protein